VQKLQIADPPKWNRSNHFLELFSPQPNQRSTDSECMHVTDSENEKGVILGTLAASWARVTGVVCPLQILYSFSGREQF